MTRKRKGLSPILATVILIGITVAAGGAVYAIWTGSSASASSSNVIRVDSLTAVKGSNHADFAITVTNSGSTPWKTIEVWASKEATGRPILYEELHEMATGTSLTADQAAAEIKNPLRAEAIGKTSDGFGIGIGRKFVASTTAPAERTVAVEGLAVPSDGKFNFIDSKWKGSTPAADCSTTLIDTTGDGTGDEAGCKVRTTMRLNSPIGAGQSMRFYADLIMSNTLDTSTKDGLGLRVNEQLAPVTINVGDELVVNIRVIGINNEEAQIQTVVQVTGV
ncbi:MAG: archaellin/type IV pilin N-terminal domain-containing protein [Nitrososphaerales archaeon]